jgi:hypothetical protein
MMVRNPALPDAFVRLRRGGFLISGILGPWEPRDLPMRPRLASSNALRPEPNEAFRTLVPYVQRLRGQLPYLTLFVGTFAPPESKAVRILEALEEKFRHRPIQRRIGPMLDGDLHDLSVESYASVLIHLGVGDFAPLSILFGDSSPYTCVLLFSATEPDLEKAAIILERTTDERLVRSKLLKEFDAFLVLTEHTDFVMVCNDRRWASLFLRIVDGVAKA